MNGRHLALAAGIFYVLTFAFSVPVLGLYEPVLDDPEYVLGPGADNQVLFGGLLEFLLALCCVGTTVALYPVTRRISPTLGLGFVASRLLEAALILVGMVSVLAVVTLRQEAGGSADSLDGLVETSSALVAVHDWTFTFGQGFMPAINALCLATVLYRARLVPRILPLLGLVGAPLLFGSKVVVVFGGLDDVEAAALLCALPIAAWELGLGCWLIAKGFRPVPEPRRPQADEARQFVHSP